MFFETLIQKVSISYIIIQDKYNMAEKEIHILYVDDEENNLTSFRAAFRREYTVYTALSAAEGKKILEENPINIIVTDQRMPEMTGIQFLESILGEYPDPIRILLTGYADMEAVIDAINKGQVYKYITKPWDENDFKITIDKAYEVYRLREENKELMKSLVRANKQLEFMLRQKLIS